MEANDTIKLSRRLRKNWLVVLSIVLLIASAYFIIKSEERRNAKNANITDSNGTEITPDLFISVTSTGEFYTIWQVPKNIEPGIYDVYVNDGTNDASISFTVN